MYNVYFSVFSIVKLQNTTKLVETQIWVYCYSLSFSLSLFITSFPVINELMMSKTNESKYEWKLQTYVDSVYASMKNNNSPSLSRCFSFLWFSNTGLEVVLESSWNVLQVSHSTGTGCSSSLSFQSPVVWSHFSSWVSTWWTSLFLDVEWTTTTSVT